MDWRKSGDGEELGVVVRVLTSRRCEWGLVNGGREGGGGEGESRGFLLEIRVWVSREESSEVDRNLLREVGVAGVDVRLLSLSMVQVFSLSE